jgi:hypothetical protein
MAGYATVCKRIDDSAKQGGRWVCFFCDQPLGKHASHHHLKGRDGDLLTDEKYIVLSHHRCHVELWHGTPHSILESYWWWDGFQQRLKKLLNEDTKGITGRGV